MALRYPDPLREQTHVARGELQVDTPFVSLGTSTDQDLLYAVARGDRAALADLYRLHAGRMFALAIHMLKDRREAEDLVHDVFVEAWQHSGDYDCRRGSVRAWLLMRLRSRALDRRRSTRARQVALVADFDDMRGEDAFHDAPDHGRMRSALLSLTAHQRAVLELGYFRGLSSQEIADHLGIPIGTVKSRVSAALVQLRQHLCVGEPPDASIGTGREKGTASQ